MTTPLVSVCLLTFNHERYIRDALAGALAQAEDIPIEILVGDDRSEDATSAIVAEYAARHPGLVKHCLRVQRHGSSRNYQALLREARGEFIATLDGDDFWLPGKLREQVRFLRENPECAAVYTNAVVVADDGVVLGLFNNPLPSRFDENELLRRGNFLHNSSILYRAVERDAILSFPAPYLDYKAHLHFAANGGIGYLNQALSGYRTSSATSLVVNANDTVRELYWNALEEVPRDRADPVALASGMADFLRRVLFRSVRVRRPKLMTHWAKRVFRASPVGPARTAWLFAGSVSRTAIEESIGWLLGRFGTQAKIFYRR